MVQMMQTAAYPQFQPRMNTGHQRKSDNHQRKARYKRNKSKCHADKNERRADKRIKKTLPQRPDLETSLRCTKFIFLFFSYRHNSNTPPFQYGSKDSLFFIAENGSQFA